MFAGMLYLVSDANKLTLGQVVPLHLGAYEDAGSYLAVQRTDTAIGKILLESDA